MRLDWEAAYLDGRTAARRRAGVHITRTGLDVTVPGTGPAFFWPFREIRKTQGTYAGEQVRLERGGELAEALLIGDVGFLSAAGAASPEATHFHDPARRRFRVGLTFGALVAAVALAVGIYYIGIPAFAAVAAARVPVSWEDKLGSAIVEHFAPPAQRCDDPARQARIDGIVAALTAKARPQPYTFRVTVVNSSIVNAVAAPGGHVILFRGLLERTDSAEELAGVLAHEVEHVLHRHVTRAIFQQASTGVLMAALVGDVSSLVAYGLEGARTLGDLRMNHGPGSEGGHDGMRALRGAGNGGRDGAAHAEPLHAERVAGGGELEVDRLDQRQVAGDRHRVVHQATRQQLAIGVVGHVLEECAAHALRDAAVHLAVHDDRIDDLAAVVGDDVAHELYRARVAIDVDDRHVHGAREGDGWYVVVSGGVEVGRDDAGPGEGRDGRLHDARAVHGRGRRAAHEHSPVLDLEVVRGGLEQGPGRRQHLGAHLPRGVGDRVAPRPAAAAPHPAA